MAGKGPEMGTPANGQPESVRRRENEVLGDECIAETNNGYPIFGGRGNLDPMMDVDGNTIAVASAKTDELIMVQYTDTSP